jgi:single-stranded DNA-binding protein
MAKRTIIGRVGTAPEVTKSPTGKDLAKFRLAETGWDPKERTETTTWYTVSAWEEQAMAVKDNVEVGARVYVTGDHSTFNGTSGAVEQINAREIGAADRFVAAMEEDIPF